MQRRIRMTPPPMATRSDDARERMPSARQLAEKVERQRAERQREAARRARGGLAVARGWDFFVIECPGAPGAFKWPQRLPQ